MRIISKYKDFYDFECGYDTDDTLVWNRDDQRIIENEELASINRKYFDEIRRKLKEGQTFYTNTRWFNHSKYVRGRKEINVNLINVYIGIYPCVYKIVYMNTDDLYHSIGELENVILDEELFKNFDDFSKKITNTYNKDYIIKFPRLTGWSKKSNFGLRKIEAPEIFNAIGSPVFCYSDRLCTNYNLVNSSIKGLVKYIKSVGSDRDFYTDIENFLYSQKTEPVSVQDNNSKILSHGFDLKTSFRKM